MNLKQKPNFKITIHLIDQRCYMNRKLNGIDDVEDDLYNPITGTFNSNSDAFLYEDGEANNSI